jgi:8-oxo-dGTP diphosphatase
MKYKNPKLTVDGILIINDKILLIKRKNDPYKNMWALPGGYVEYKETTENAIIREFFEETGLEVKIKELNGVYSDPDRDPRGHTITIVYTLDKIKGDIKYGDDAADAKFFSIESIPHLAFDHEKIIRETLRRKKICFVRNANH